MILSAPSGDHLGLRIEGYEFPGIWDDEFDSNWLIVTGNVRSAGRGWSFRDPCLLVDEAISLASWLTALADRRAGILTQRLDFLEPELVFCFSGDPGDPDFRLRSELDYLALPRSWPESSEAVILEFAPTEAELRLAAESLREDVERFPKRARRWIR